MSRTLTIYDKSDIYEITLSGASIQRIRHLSLSSPEPKDVYLRSLSERLRELIIDRIKENGDAEV